MTTVEAPEMLRQENTQGQGPEPEGEHISGVFEVEVPNPADQHVADHQVEKPQSTFSVEEDRPWPRGLANGVWKDWPIKPLRQWGSALASNTPPKK